MDSYLVDRSKIVSNDMGKEVFLIITGLLFGSISYSFSNVKGKIDILHYNVSLIISMQQMSVKGFEVIDFVVNSDSLQKVNFDFEKLQLQDVTDHNSNCNFRQLEDEVEIDLSKIYHRGDTVSIKLQYQGKPRKGLKFFPDANQVYQVHKDYSTYSTFIFNLKLQAQYLLASLYARYLTFT